MGKRTDSAGGDSRGEAHKVDTAKLPGVPGASMENLKASDTQRPGIPGSDPYNSAPALTDPVRGPLRRGLDDARQLSTQIKGAVAGEQGAVTPTSDLALRLAGLRVELERVLADMETLRGLAVNYADRKAVGLMLQLRLSVQHLEDAIDSLISPDEL